MTPDESRAIRLHEAAHATVAQQLRIPIKKIIITETAHGVLAWQPGEDARRETYKTDHPNLDPTAVSDGLILLADKRLKFFLAGYANEADSLLAGFRSADDLASFFGLIHGLCDKLTPEESTQRSTEAFLTHLHKARTLVTAGRDRNTSSGSRYTGQLHR